MATSSWWLFKRNVHSLSTIGKFLAFSMNSSNMRRKIPDELFEYAYARLPTLARQLRIVVNIDITSFLDL